MTELKAREINGFFPKDEYEKLIDTLLVYEWGQKLLMAKMQIIFDSQKHFQNHNPVEHVKARVKSPESIAGKLRQLNMDITVDNARQALKDLAGIRIICSYAKDIYYLAEILESIPGTEVLEKKDYVSHPKKSGYRSYHLTLNVSVFHSGITETIPIEIQLRTAAMDFWATLEHKVRYKYKDHIPKHLSDELSICAEKTAELDNRMFLIHDIISLINQ